MNARSLLAVLSISCVAACSSPPGAPASRTELPKPKETLRTESVLCPDGSWADSECNLCPDGTWHDECGLCPDGSFGCSSSGGTMLCPDGTWHTSCGLCPDGHFGC
jgi:hypothetical protein